MRRYGSWQQMNGFTQVWSGWGVSGRSAASTSGCRAVASSRDHDLHHRLVDVEGHGMVDAGPGQFGVQAVPEDAASEFLVQAARRLEEPCVSVLAGIQRVLYIIAAPHRVLHLGLHHVHWVARGPGPHACQAATDQRTQDQEAGASKGQLPLGEEEAVDGEVQAVARDLTGQRGGQAAEHNPTEPVLLQQLPEGIHLVLVFTRVSSLHYNLQALNGIDHERRDEASKAGGANGLPSCRPHSSTEKFHCKVVTGEGHTLDDHLSQHDGSHPRVEPHDAFVLDDPDDHAPHPQGLAPAGDQGLCLRLDRVEGVGHTNANGPGHGASEQGSEGAQVKKGQSHPEPAEQGPSYKHLLGLDVLLDLGWCGSCGALEGGA
mmetsp:Transcript_30627/g.55066  ORF Transcript_30627/g.55066 Transcript_30627/m.55066 type:complete len:374 (+) Transcript_30627:216-1337(+)